MITIKQLVENTKKLDYPAICQALMERFSVPEPVNWNSVLPVPQQQELFGGEILRLIADYEADHIKVANQKDIRPISLMRGSVSQMLFFFTRLNDASLPKKQIEQITKRFKKGPEANRFIVWFFGNKDSSQLKVVLSAREGKKIVLKTLPFGVNQPYYKTYNLILDEVASKVNRMFVEPTELWKALWSAFDISVVNRTFYKEIKEAFDGLILNELSKSKHLFTDDTSKVQFSIRLLGRIIFCWFLKRKGIIDKSVLSSEAVAQNDSNYYHGLLEILFFDVFNTPLKERKRKILPSAIADYPFLNGGLFDAQPADYKGNWQLIISNDWFYKFYSNTLERYNFTVDENSSSSEEIAIDPEMLGRIFENLLAEQVSETKAFASDRKSTGSFYTPRQIVDYMVETSIVEYLQSFYPKNLHSLLQEFVHEERLPDSLKKKEGEILNLLSKVKVIDPACGSGAFPMSILHKLTQLKSELDKGKSSYQIKLESIEQSIYGVDNQPMATELSRLRCWLSLVVDENINKVKPLPNLDFKFITANSIVDLGFDTFIQKAQKEGAMFLQSFVEKVNELKNIRAKFFEVSPEDKQKDKLKAEFKKLQSELSNITLEIIKSDPKSKPIVNKFADKLLSWNPFDDSKVAPFFSQTWMFGVEDGFDIVIGNPPYIKEYTNRAVFDDIRDSEYYQGKMDIWYLFACRFLDNLKPNTGILTFIATNNWVTNTGASKFRNKVARDAEIVQLIDFGNYKIFESADIQTMVMVFRSRKQLQEYEFDYRKIIDTQATLEHVIAILNKGNSDKFLLLQPIFERTYLKDKSFLFSESSVESILQTIYEQSNFRIEPLKEIATGIQPNPDVVTKKAIEKIPQSKLKQFHIQPGDGVFVVKSDFFKTLNLKEKKLIKPLWEPYEVKRFYVPEQHEKNIIYFTKKEDPKDYPTLIEHLGKYREIMDDRRENKLGRLEFYHLHWSRDKYFFEPGPKILAVRKCTVPTFAYTEKEAYVMLSLNVIKSDRINLKYLTALLNSKLIAFWLKHKGKMQGFNYQLDQEPILELPLKTIGDTAVFENLVDYIIFINESTNRPVTDFVTNEHLIKSFEEVLNGCVYELYFENEMRQKKIDILDEARKLVKAISSVEDKQEKARIIGSVYNELKEPDNEIRNRMKLFAIESPDIILPIQKVY